MKIKASPVGLSKVLGLGAGLAILLVVYVLSAPGKPLGDLELRSRDFRFRQRGPIEPDSRIATIAIDDKSVTKIGRWPWDRAVHARLIDRLSKAGALAIGFDIIFSETQSPEADGELARAAARAGNVFFAVPAYDGPSSGEQESSLDEHVLPGVGLRYSSVRSVPSFTPPVPEIAKASAGCGVIAMPRDDDAMFRHGYLLLGSKTTGKVYPSLGLALGLQALGLHNYDVMVGGDSAVIGHGRVFPVDDKGRTLVNFVGTTDAVPRFPYIDVLEGNVSDQELNGKIILIGATAEGLPDDIRPNPFDTSAVGMDVHANMLSNILQNRPLWETSPTKSALLLFGLAIIALLVTTVLRPLPAFFIAGGLVLGYVYLAFYLFSARDLLVPVVAPSVAVFLGYLAVVTVRFTTEEQSSRELRESFKLYLPPQVVNELVRDPQTAHRLEGERRAITVMFSDLRGFTEASRRLAPDQTVALLNDYLGAMMEIAFDRGATVDKFMGDGLMLFWNAPLDQPDHALRAVQTALEMQNTLRNLGDKWQGMGLPQFRAGFGLNTGEAVIGNMGSVKRRVSYTAIGDSVNLAARLEALNKELQTEILISAATFALVGDRLDARDLGQVVIRGIEEPVHVHEVLGLKKP